MLPLNQQILIFLRQRIRWFLIAIHEKQTVSAIWEGVRAAVAKQLDELTGWRRETQPASAERVNFQGLALMSSVWTYEPGWLSPSYLEHSAPQPLPKGTVILAHLVIKDPHPSAADGRQLAHFLLTGLPNAF